MKKTLLFFSVLILAVEFPLFALAGKDIKLWMICSFLAGIFLIAEFWRGDFSLFKKSRIFYLSLFIVISSFLALPNSPEKVFSLNQILVLVLLTPLAVFWELNFSKFSKEGYFALALGLGFSSLFAVYQNWAFEKGFTHFEVMAARPNGFFYEPDWLGFYLALGLMPFIYVLIFKKQLGRDFSFFRHKIYLWFFNLLVAVALFLTVARSGWLALIVGFVTILGLRSLNLFLLKKGIPEIVKKKGWALGKFFFLIAIAYSLIFVFNLSRFDLADRFRSIFFREHVITLAVDEKTGEKLKINLEEKKDYIARGFRIIEEYIKDENVSSREEKVIQNAEIIRRHSLSGNGPGINQILTGYAHNANNLFLEWWSGWGLLALVTFVGFLGCLMKKSLSGLAKKKKKSILLGGGLVAFVVVNLFNASNLLAFAWFYLAWLSSLSPLIWPFKKKR